MWLCLFTSGVALNRAVDRSGVRRWSILLAQSETFFLSAVQLKGVLFRAPVDKERTSSFSNAVRFTLRSNSRYSSSRWCLVSSSFICISRSSPLPLNRACSSCILVCFRIRYQISSSFPLTFALLEMFAKRSPSWPLSVALFCTVWATGLSVE